MRPLCFFFSTHHEITKSFCSNHPVVLQNSLIKHGFSEVILENI